MPIPPAPPAPPPAPPMGPPAPVVRARPVPRPSAPASASALGAPVAGFAYPLPAFYFKVVFGEQSLKDETSFQEVSGLTTEMETEEVREGGENRYVQRLPKGTKNGLLVLKRAIGPAGTALVNWCRSVMEGGLSEQLLTAPLTVYLMNAEGEPVRAWLFAEAFPVKWEIDPFNATKNDVAIEKITLSYTFSQRLA